ncbi:MAG: polysaccharide deacetylase family protein [Verrucomicrobiota bacterium]
MSSRLQQFKQAAKSAVLVAFGLSLVARTKLSGQGTILTFHGLCADRAPTGVLDSSLHLPISVFRAVCEHLRNTCEVMPLREMVQLLNAGKSLPRSAVAITFDDGLGSNFHLGYPVLRELGLPATIFLATGFIDGTHSLWFQEVDRALGACGATSAELFERLGQLKALPDAEMRAEAAKLTADCSAPHPEVTLPMNWNQAREMKASGLIEFGGHTHTHPILARCTVEQQAEEIRRCRDRITAELDAAPTLFAYPNGGPTDLTADTQRLLAENGFEASFTMMPARLTSGLTTQALPRYGNPTSVLEAEATVSGAFELLKQWRGGAA